MALRRSIILLLSSTGLAVLTAGTPAPYRTLVAGGSWLALAYIYAQLTRPKDRP